MSFDSIIYNEAIEVLLDAPKVTVVIGAGVSTAAGIPAFRGDDGVHRQDFLGYRIESLFDLNELRTENIWQAHCKYIAHMAKLAVVSKPTSFHKMLFSLKQRNRLQRVYSQNIDGLEEKAGLECDSEDRTCVLLHGSLFKLRCDACSTTHMLENYFPILQTGQFPLCTNCTEHKSTAGRVLRKRATGRLRPAVTLFNSVSPEEVEIASLWESDTVGMPDNHVVMVAGTSLRIFGVQQLLKNLKRQHQRNFQVIYVDPGPLPPFLTFLKPVLLHIQRDCQCFAQSVIQRIECSASMNIIAEESSATRNDFRPIWDWS